MRSAAAVLVLVAAASAGCMSGVDGVGPCAAPTDGQAWPDRWDVGATLVTQRGSDHVEAWGCNVSQGSLWVRGSDDDCRGSWRWVAEPWDGLHSDVPPCQYDEWVRLAPGEGVQRRFQVFGEPGDQFLIGWMVYTQPEVLTDAGGGELRAIFVV